MISHPAFFNSSNQPEVKLRMPSYYNDWLHLTPSHTWSCLVYMCSSVCACVRAPPLVPNELVY